MLALNRTAAIEHLGELLARSRRGVAFTGAGISTECGIPDFRSPGGLWTKNQPIQFNDFIASQEARNEAWRRKFAMEDRFQAAKPGRGHRALAALVASGKLAAVITQNIDNLHQLSGIPEPRVIELHGNGSYAICLDCHARYELDWVRVRFVESGGIAPDCTACSG